MAICTGWNALAKENKCRIKRGKTAYVYVGPGESVSEQTCRSSHSRPGEHYGRAADLQVTFHSAPAEVCEFE